METLALYLLKVHVVISLLYGGYYLLVSKEHFLRLNRFFLLAILLISFSAPLFSGLSILTINASYKDKVSAQNYQYSVSDWNDHSIAGKEVSKFDDEIQIKRLSGVITSLLMFYLCFVGFFLIRFLHRIWNVCALFGNCEPKYEHNIKYLDPGEDIAAFSFFRSIVIYKDQHTKSQLKQIIAHEQAHSKQWHSADILLAELASVLLWGNPFVKGLKKTMKLNLEFLADKDVLRQGFDKEEYQWSILMPYLKQNAYPLTNLYSSKPKQRIERMNAKKGSLFNLYKYLLVIPILIFVYGVVAPFHAAALDKIYIMKLIDEHEYRDYLGYYEFEKDKGSYVRIMMKDETLIMNTLWNNQKISFRKQANNGFVNMETGIPLQFPRHYGGGVTGLVAFGEDRWKKVYKYTPVMKKSGEGTVISRSPSGGMQVLVYAIEPWSNVRHYTTKKAESSP